MLTTSLDTLLACSVMVVLALSSMVGILTVVNPYLQNQPSGYEKDLNHRLAEYLILDPGDAPDWGSCEDGSLSSFGLAKAGCTAPFELDIDKVTRLNQENAYGLSFRDAFLALGLQDRPFRIRVEPLFDVTLSLVSQRVEDADTVYHFSVQTERSNLPVATNLGCYAVLGDYAANVVSSTSSSGQGTVEVALPNSLDGTALMIAIAEVEPGIVSYDVYAFKHRSSGDPYPQRTFTMLSPLNFTLRAEISYSEEQIVGVKVFTYDYYFNLTMVDEDPGVEYYAIPRLLDPSPMVLVVTGLNESTSFAEWVTYPQVPLDFGSNFTRQQDVMDSFPFQFLVSINSALYACEIALGGT